MFRMLLDCYISSLMFLLFSSLLFSSRYNCSVVKVFEISIIPTSN